MCSHALRPHIWGGQHKGKGQEQNVNVAVEEAQQKGRTCWTGSPAPIKPRASWNENNWKNIPSAGVCEMWCRRVVLGARLSVAKGNAFLSSAVCLAAQRAPWQGRLFGSPAWAVVGSCDKHRSLSSGKTSCMGRTAWQLKPPSKASWGLALDTYTREHRSWVLYHLFSNI